jgi:hypothetical protein
MNDQTRFFRDTILLCRRMNLGIASTVPIKCTAFYLWIPD